MNMFKVRRQISSFRYCLLSRYPQIKLFLIPRGINNCNKHTLCKKTMKFNNNNLLVHVVFTCTLPSYAQWTNHKLIENNCLSRGEVQELFGQSITSQNRTTWRESGLQEEMFRTSNKHFVQSAFIYDHSEVRSGKPCHCISKRRLTDPDSQKLNIIRNVYVRMVYRFELC